MASAEARGPSMMRTGSPGISCTSTNVTKLMPISTGTSCSGRRSTKANRSIETGASVENNAGWERSLPPGDGLPSALHRDFVDGGVLIAGVQLHVLDLGAVDVAIGRIVESDLRDL